MVQLVVTEKPSVARDLARIMGVRGRRDGYLEGDRIWITWCYGHLVTLAEPERQDASWKRWSRDTLPMIPESFELDTIASSRDQYGVVRKLLRSKDIDEVINACDAGREGELIFRYVYELTGCRKNVRRLWLASLTDQSVRHAWRAMRPGSDYDALGDAARSRAEADWLVGLNATRAMTIKSRQAGARGELMSVGRVQTPTLALLAERERAIEEFVPEPFWQVFAKFDAAPQDDGIPTTYEGVWTRPEDPEAAKPGKDETPQERKQRYKEERERRERLQSADAAQAIVDAVQGEVGEIMRVHEKDVRERPPLLFDLTALQREANKRFGYSAKRTLDLAQSLYERHKLLTYPRTDSRHLTKDMQPKLEGLLETLSVGSYEPFCETLLSKKLEVGKRIVDDAQVTDHHAIIPTEKTPSSDGLDRDEIRIYDLVARRFIAAFFPDAVFATTRIETTVGEHLFVTRGRSRKQAGWQEVEGTSSSSSARGKRSSQPLLPTLARGQEVPVEDTRTHQGVTQPPRRFTENTLLGSMERAGRELDDEELRGVMKESGLGTPATRASVIETLLRREYIERRGKSLSATAKGRALIDAVPAQALKSAQLTGEWEAGLNRISTEDTSRSEFMAEVRRWTAELVEQILTSELNLPESMSAPPPDDGLGPCPLCQTQVTEIPQGFTCQTGRACDFFIGKRIAKRKMSKGLVKLLLAGKTSKTLKGFESKQNKPFQAALRLDDRGKVVFVFDRDDASATTSSTSSRAPSSAPRKKAAGPKKKASSKKKAPATDASGNPEQPYRSAARSAERAPRARAAEVSGPRACPKCGQGHLIRGKRAWGCSRWREGCDYVES